MNLFRLFAVLGLLLSANLMAGGPLEEEGKCLPRVLRGVKVTGQSYVDITSKDASRVFPRIIEGQFSVISPYMDWTVYRFQNAVGLFWTEKETEAYKTLKATGVKIDFDPDAKSFSLSEETLKGMIVTAEKFKIPLWDALLKYQIDDNGILIITE